MSRPLYLSSHEYTDVQVRRELIKIFPVMQSLGPKLSDMHCDMKRMGQVKVATELCLQSYARAIVCLIVQRNAAPKNPSQLTCVPYPRILSALCLNPLVSSSVLLQEIDFRVNSQSPTLAFQLLILLQINAILGHHGNGILIHAPRVSVEQYLHALFDRCHSLVSR